MTMLSVLSSLPGVGKMTIARELVRGVRVEPTVG